MMMWFKTFVKIKVYLWLVLLTFLVVGVVYFFGMLKGGENRLERSQSYSMVKYLKEAEEVVFLTVGIQRIEAKRQDSKIPWTEIGIPATEKQALIILSYEAKLGIKTAVDIKETGEKSFTITIPKFEVIGVTLDKEHPYRLYDKRGGLLSAMTDDIDTGKLVSEKMSNKDQEKYLEEYRDMLKRSAESYYSHLFAPIDPEIKLTFNYID